MYPLHPRQAINASHFQLLIIGRYELMCIKTTINDKHKNIDNVTRPIAIKAFKIPYTRVCTQTNTKLT